MVFSTFELALELSGRFAEAKLALAAIATDPMLDNTAPLHV